MSRLHRLAKKKSEMVLDSLGRGMGGKKSRKKRSTPLSWGTHPTRGKERGKGLLSLLARPKEGKVSKGDGGRRERKGKLIFKRPAYHAWGAAFFGDDEAKERKGEAQVGRKKEVHSGT